MIKEELRMEVFWLGHAAFKIITNSGKIIYLDPFQLKKEPEKADIIIISHSHGDHFSNIDIKKLLKETTLLIGPESIATRLKKYNGKCLKIGDIFSIEDIKITLFPAYTINLQTHPKNNEWAGSIIETEGKIIYHAGDTEKIPEMKKLAKYNIDVAMLPCGGKYTMAFEEACESAKDIKPKIVIPMHNWDLNLSEFKKIMEQKDPNIKVEILENKSLKL